MVAGVRGARVPIVAAAALGRGAVLIRRRPAEDMVVPVQLRKAVPATPAVPIVGLRVVLAVATAAPKPAPSSVGAATAQS